MSYDIRPVGRVESPLADPADAPRQGDEGAPDAVLVLDASVADAARNIGMGDDLLVLTWLHLGDRETLIVHPRGDPNRAREGVFTTRSPDRPNPIGLHRVRVRSVDGLRITVAGLEAVNGTPIVDIKPVLGGVEDR